VYIKVAERPPSPFVKSHESELLVAWHVSVEKAPRAAQLSAGNWGGWGGGWPHVWIATGPCAWLFWHETTVMPSAHASK
jgi:hypothetical protein